MLKVEIAVLFLNFPAVLNTESVAAPLCGSNEGAMGRDIGLRVPLGIRGCCAC